MRTQKQKVNYLLGQIFENKDHILLKDWLPMVWTGIPHFPGTDEEYVQDSGEFAGYEFRLFIKNL